ncbi:hypothetical protein ES703_106814 [subsurface metagenome]
MADRARDQVNILVTLLPRLGAIIDAINKTIVCAGHNLRRSGRPPGWSHMGHLHGVRAPLCEPGHIALRQFSLLDQSFEA